MNTPPLFCKPPANNQPNQILFEKHYPNLKGTIQFRSLNLKEDLKTIHAWVNSSYALEYWQMDGQFSQLFAIYQCMAYNPFAHSFVGYLTPNPSPHGEGSLQPPSKMICQFDVYSIAVDELADHLEFESHDCGFHLLMSPNEQPIKGLTVSVVNAFLEYYFSFSEAKAMYAEPDITNLKSILLLGKTGFRKIKRVEMSYKTADVYLRTRTPSSP